MTAAPAGRRLPPRPRAYAPAPIEIHVQTALGRTEASQSRTGLHARAHFVGPRENPEKPAFAVPSLSQLLFRKGTILMYFSIDFSYANPAEGCIGSFEGPHGALDAEEIALGRK